MAISEPSDPPAASRGELGSASGKVESIVGARRLLTINTGSSSLKAALYRLRGDPRRAPGRTAGSLRRARRPDESAARSGARPGRPGGGWAPDRPRRGPPPRAAKGRPRFGRRSPGIGADRPQPSSSGNRSNRGRGPGLPCGPAGGLLRHRIPQPDAPRRQALRASEAARTGGHHPLRFPRSLLRVRDGGAAPSRTRGGRRARRRRRHDHGLYPDRRARDGHEERRPRPGRATLFVGGAGHVPDRSERSRQQTGRSPRRLGDERGHARLAGPRAGRRARSRGGRSLLLPGEEVSGGFGRCSWRARRPRLHGRHRRALSNRQGARLRGPRVPRHPARHRSQRGARAGHHQRRRRGDRLRRADRRRSDGRPAHEKAHRAGTLSREEQSMYRFDPNISSVVEEAAPPRPALSPEEPAEGPLSAEQLAGIHRYWQAANYLTVGQIYLQDNPLLRQPLRPEHIKPRLLGHWGTSPGLSFVYAHLNRLIREHGADVIYLAGPGHGGPAVLANVYLEGTYSEVYPDVSQDVAGMRRLFRQFSTPGGVPSHVSVPTPGSIHEGGELGYVLAHAFGAAFDNPDLIVAAVVGDGEAETGPLEGSWKGISFLNPVRDGAVLPILHLNGYKIANPTVLGRAEDGEVRSILEGHGYAVHFVEGETPHRMHQAFAATLDRCHAEMCAIQREAREGGYSGRPRWPAIVLRTPKGWTGPSELYGLPVEGTFRSHQVPLPDARSDPEQLAMLEEWMRS